PNASARHSLFVPRQPPPPTLFPYTTLFRSPAATLASAGHVPVDPVQLSATSHWPAEARQTVAADLNASLQVVALVPEQRSLASSSQERPRQTSGHAAVSDLQLSAEHTPLDP